MATRHFPRLKYTFIIRQTQREPSRKGTALSVFPKFRLLDTASVHLSNEDFDAITYLLFLLPIFHIKLSKMPRLRTMPPIVFPQDELAEFGQMWTTLGGRLNKTRPYSSIQLGSFIDATVGHALAEMLGGIPVVKPIRNSLVPPMDNCVEVGPVLIEGGVRPQNFDCAYRPTGVATEGVRFAFDSKTLNLADSIGKNWYNMVNDIVTESATVHSVYPNALSAFIIVLPMPALREPRRSQMIRIFERIAQRNNPADQHYLIEVVSFVLWNPSDGSIDQHHPPPDSRLRIEKFSTLVERFYRTRFEDLPPHDRD